MFINSLYLHNFRNYIEEEFAFSKGVNLILGDNAQGKTNVLQGISALAAVRTSKPPLRQESVRFGEQIAEVMGYVSHENVETKLSLRLDTSKRITEVYKNDVRQKRLIDVNGLLRIVTFCPEDLHLIRAGAAQRRNFLDKAICQLSPRYAQALQKYEKIFAEKHKIVKNHENNQKFLPLLDDYTEQLCHYGAQIILSRARYCAQLLNQAARIHSIAAPHEQLSAQYKTTRALMQAFPMLQSWGEIQQQPSTVVSIQTLRENQMPDLKNVKNVLTEYALSMRANELAAHSVLVGPHKDDFEILINERHAASFCSQGQIRTATLALKLAEREVSFVRDGLYPVLLLDDVLSELDKSRQDFVLNQVENGQVFITACDPIAAERFDKGRRFVIENGACVERSGSIIW